MVSRRKIMAELAENMVIFIVGFVQPKRWIKKSQTLILPNFDPSVPEKL